MNRSPMPTPGGFAQNPEMANAINQSPTFMSIQDQMLHERNAQAMRYDYVYHLSATVTGQQTQAFDITIEQGTDFKSIWLTGHCFSYDAVNATDFPIPNSLGATSWAGDGLSIQITDTRSGRQLTSGFVPAKELLTPGYGLNFQQPYPMKYYWYRNSKIRFDIRNRDNNTRSHTIDIALKGYKILSPNG